VISFYDAEPPQEPITKRQTMDRATAIRSRVLRECGCLTEAQDPVITESDELVRIVATIIPKAEAQTH